MSEPRFTAEHGVYTCSWSAPLHIRITLERVRAEARSGDVTAEVEVHSTQPNRPGLLHYARLTITGTQSRKTLAKHLESRTPGQAIDWDGLIEAAAVKTLRAFRRGEPHILLRDALQPIDAGFLLPPIVLGRLPVIWYGDGGTGKSLLALAAGLSIHTGRSDLIDIAPAAKRRVAFLDFEMDAWEQRERMRQLAGEPLPDLVYVRCRGPIWDEIDRLEHIVQEEGIGFVVIDSVGMACPGIPIESSEAPLRFFDAIRHLGVGSLCVAHRALADGREDHPFGSVFWANSARATFFLKKQQDMDAARLAVAMYSKKSNVSRAPSPLAFEITFDDSHIRIRRQDVRDHPELAQTLPIRYRMEHALKHGPKTYVELGEEIGASPDSIGQAARRGDGKAFVILKGRGDEPPKVALLQRA